MIPADETHPSMVCEVCEKKITAKEPVVIYVRSNGAHLVLVCLSCAICKPEQGAMAG